MGATSQLLCSLFCLYSVFRYPSVFLHCFASVCSLNYPGHLKPIEQALSCYTICTCFNLQVNTFLTPYKNKVTWVHFMRLSEKVCFIFDDLPLFILTNMSISEKGAFAEKNSASIRAERERGVQQPIVFLSSCHAAPS